MSIPSNPVSIGGTTKKSHYDALYDNAILCDTGGTAGGAQTIPGKKDFTNGIGVDYITGLSSGNVIGFGTTDLESWDSGYGVIEFPYAAIMANSSSNIIHYLCNVYYDGAWKYKSTAEASGVLMGSGGTFQFRTAVSGTINTALTWVEKFKIDNATDSIGIGGYAGGSDRDSYIYLASNFYFFWDESQTKLNIIGANNIDLQGDVLRFGGGAGGSNRDVQIYWNSTLYWLWDQSESYMKMFTNINISGNFDPGVHKTYDIGQSSLAFDDVYADDFNNVADFLHLDSHDDLEAIMGIKGSGIIDPRSGLEIIDDDTLPEWLLTKTKDGKSIEKTPNGKPYLSLKTINSLCIGAIRQLNLKVEAQQIEINELKGVTE